MDNEIKYKILDPGLTAEALNELYAQVGWNSSGQRTAEKTAQMLATSSLYVSAFASGNLVGFGRLLSDPYTAHILDVITHPEYRQRGIARRVTELLLENLPEGLLGVSLTAAATRRSTNPWASRLQIKLLTGSCIYGTIDGRVLVVIRH